MRPLAIDLFCGLGGWTDGLLAEGYYVVGFDIEQHVYGEHRYPGQLVLQDVTTLHGSQFRDATLIVASPPCQAYSYRAMPWKKAKALPPPDNTLFETCFRIQREACEAANRHIPLIVENVRGAQKWVGRARWNYGSFYLWGDVPALMPPTLKAAKVPGFRFDGSGGSFQTASVEHGRKNNGGSWFNFAHNTTSGKGQNPDGRKTSAHPNVRDDHPHTKHLTNPVEHTGIKAPGMNWSDQTKRGQDFTRIAADHIKNNGGSWFNFAHNTTSGKGQNPDGRKIGGDWFSDPHSTCRRHSSKSKGRKMASAMIAKIPLPLSRHIARTALTHLQSREAD